MHHSARNIAEQIQKRAMSCREATMTALDAIGKANSTVNAFVHVFEERALRQADAVQKKLDAGEKLPPLAGVPMAVKDNICVKDTLTTCCSKMLSGFKPPYHATVIDKLEAAGAVILGKLNMDEFAMGSTTETSVNGPVKNPWDRSRVAGGSSGGSAAAVAAALTPYSLGSDTGGSIRLPCSFCGVSGIKPTYGAVSRYGLIAYASSMDQIGPIGQSIKDCAQVLRIIAGKDQNDMTSANWTPDLTGCFDGDLKGMRIGIPKQYMQDGIAKDVCDAVLGSVHIFEQCGAVAELFDLPLTDLAVPAYYIIACAEASANLSRYDGIRYGYRSQKIDTLDMLMRISRSEGFGMEVKRRIMLGTFVLSEGYYEAYYQKAMQVRSLIGKHLATALEHYNFILAPTAPNTAFKMGAVTDPLQLYLNDAYTVAVNLAGLPAVSIPCGFDRQQLPIGMQLIGRPFDEAVLVKGAHAFQMHTDYHLKHPVAKEVIDGPA